MSILNYESRDGSQHVNLLCNQAQSHYLSRDSESNDFKYNVVFINSRSRGVILDSKKRMFNDEKEGGKIIDDFQRSRTSDFSSHCSNRGGIPHHSFVS